MENRELTAEEISSKIEAQIKKDAEYKAQYKYIRKAVQVDENNVEHVAYFKEPSRMAIGCFMAIAETDVLQGCEYLFDSAIITEISDVNYFRNNDAVFIGINRMLQGLVQVKKSTFTT